MLQKYFIIELSAAVKREMLALCAKDERASLGF